MTPLKGVSREWDIIMGPFDLSQNPTNKPSSQCHCPTVTSLLTPDPHILQGLARGSELCEALSRAQGLSDQETAELVAGGCQSRLHLPNHEDSVGGFIH